MVPSPNWPAYTLPASDVPNQCGWLSAYVNKSPGRRQVAVDNRYPIQSRLRHEAEVSLSVREIGAGARLKCQSRYGEYFRCRLKMLTESSRLLTINAVKLEEMAA